MRVIDYYNMAALILLTAVIVYAGVGLRQHGADADTYAVRHGVSYRTFLILILVLGAALRFVLLGAVPYGLQQDEASIGYEAYCLLHYGVDRHGYAWPVYPITWGSGGGSPLMIYLNVITTALFGSKVTSIRFVTAFLGTLTLVLFYRILRRTTTERTALAGLFLLAICPWHIILSRWSLDSNTMPFFQLAAMLLLVRGALAEKRRLRWYVAGCMMAAVCLYDYGSATIVIPLFLLLYVIVLLRRGRINGKEVALCVVAFGVICLPIGYFYGVQYCGLPEVNLSWISFNKFTASHASAFSAPSVNNLLDILRILSVGVAHEDLWNAMPSYAALYRFLAPLLVIGLVVAIRTSFSHGADADPAASSERAASDLFLCMFVAAALFGLFINVDINRMVLIFVPAIYFETLGLRWLMRALRKCKAGHALNAVVFLMILCAFLSFAKDYYGGYYNEYAASVFMPGYGEAMEYANNLALAADAAGSDLATADAESSTDPDATSAQTTVYSTYSDVASPFMITLYYTKYDPYEFMETAEWKDLGAEFQVASAFGRFVFGLPDERPEDAIYVVTKSEAAEFSEEDYTFTEFGNFVVIALDPDAA